MRKQSQMGCSKYEFNHDQFDIDIKSNHLRYEQRKDYIKQQLYNIIISDPARMEESFSIMLDTLRNIKQEYNL